MLCDACKKNPATIHSMTIINGAKQERYLCAQCANAAQQYSVPSLMDMLGGFYAGKQRRLQSTCTCGMNAAVFQKRGLLGCADCYDNLREQLMPVIKQVQGGRIRHVGRTPVQVEEQNKPEQQPQQSELEQLKASLKAAVASEQYERAAELRDRIKALEAKEE